jgi:hypothetical protein
MRKLVNVALGLLIMFGLALMTMAWAGCDTLKSAGNAGKQILVDCTKKEVATVVDELGPVVEHLIVDTIDGEGSIDWDPIKESATKWTAEIGGCIVADVVSRALAPPPTDPKAPQISPLQVDHTKLRQGFEAFRAERFGGIHFKTRSGTL